MEERVIRATAAVSPVPKTTTGIIMDRELAGLKVAGSQCSLMAKVRMKIKPCQKFGMDKPRRAMNIKV
ncbi:hypothetical protein D3C71_2187000 [compost metagenome]